MCILYNLKGLKMPSIQIECISSKGPSKDLNKHREVEIYASIRKSKNMALLEVQMSHEYMSELVGVSLSS